MIHNSRSSGIDEREQLLRIGSVIYWTTVVLRLLRQLTLTAAFPKNVQAGQSCLLSFIINLLGDTVIQQRCSA